MRNNYSSSKQIGEYIAEKVQENDVIICLTDYTTTPVTLYAPNHLFISPQTGKQISFVTWNEERKRHITERDITKIIEKNRGQSIYLLYSVNREFDSLLTSMKNSGKLKRVFTTQRALQPSEVYQLYQIKIVD